MFGGIEQARGSVGRVFGFGSDGCWIDSRCK